MCTYKHLQKSIILCSFFESDGLFHFNFNLCSILDRVGDRSDRSKKRSDRFSIEMSRSIEIWIDPTGSRAHINLGVFTLVRRLLIPFKYLVQILPDEHLAERY